MIRVKADPVNKKVFFGIDNLSRRHKKAIRNASFDIGQESKREVRKRINNTGRTGRIYRIGGRVHRASAPGEAPANLSGRLKKSVDYDVRGHQQMEIGYKALHGRFLEDGTKNMDRRPNLRPVADDMVQTFINYMVDHFNRGRA